MSILSQLQSDPRGAIIMLLYRIPAVLIALTLHELAHGYVALKRGDPTAQMLGRLSFNPLRHLDPVGSIFMLLFGFGWARPVPVNPRNFKRFRLDDFLVSIAGVTVNFILFFFATIFMVGLNQLIFSPELWETGFPLITQKDFLSFDGANFSAIFTGSNELFTHTAGGYYYYFNYSDASHLIRYPDLLYLQRFFMTFAMVNLGLAVFNLLPIPPLDGSHVLNDILAKGRLHIPYKVMQFLPVALIMLMLFTDVITNFISAIIYFVQSGVLSAILWVFGVA